MSAMVAAPVDFLGGILLHGGAQVHAAESSGGLQMEFLAVSAAVVGLAGGLLYWYYGQRVESG